ncbi:CLUMA_CG011860, isoform A [Clunio marinus]|uniref:CLUMA_CG011860, isoform A n=1 Tax=Clunio marinus TaxID=568069 RepID=A0A1J1IE67_9DIPT|nr:CLUMA_CG011860, isoform A [Clunio marinus]
MDKKVIMQQEEIFFYIGNVRKWIGNRHFDSPSIKRHISTRYQTKINGFGCFKSANNINYCIPIMYRRVGRLVYKGSRTSYTFSLAFVEQV